MFMLHVQYHRLKFLGSNEKMKIDFTRLGHIIDTFVFGGQGLSMMIRLLGDLMLWSESKCLN